MEQQQQQQQQQQGEEQMDLLPPQEQALVDKQAFSRGTVLSNTEVAFLLDAYKGVRMGNNPNFQLPATVKKTKDYVEKFATSQNVTDLNQETLRNIRRMCLAHGLKQFEYAAVVNTMPETAEEAIALVPSLKDPERFNDDKLTQLLSELAMFRQYQ